MSKELIAIEDLEVKFDNSAGPPDILYIGDQPLDAVKITTTLISEMKSGGKEVATDKISCSFLAGGNECPHTSATYTFVSGLAEIQTSDPETTSNGVDVLRNNDTSLTGCAGQWTLTAAPNTPIACACAVKISNAGQTVLFSK